MPRNLDTSLLRTFVTVARGASMTTAAHALHVTQGAVSQQIKRLESCLGLALFERARSGLKLTEAGERLLDNAERLIELNDRIWTDMRGTAFAGEVRIGVPYDLVDGWLAGILKSFAQRYPQVELSLVCLASPQLLGALNAGEVDLAIVEQRVGEPGGECLRVEPLQWVGAPGGSAYLKRPLAVSIVSDTCAFRPAIFDALRLHGVPWRTVFENANLDATRATVRMDMAVTAWLDSTVPADLQVLPREAGLPSLPEFAIHLHLPAVPLAAPVQEMVRFIREGFAAAAPEGVATASAVPQGSTEMDRFRQRSAKIERLF
ncbi:LysR substrate-binding domain-containing protein [Paraburkholderia phenazinium]|jgi:DNA-binding transcriptional LysR family regulator|uniref:Transcriptional regulator, LysR family n=1 Tax=Paraburkholderia phenazinium TaxID=60549 RepID=A0A1N6L4C6_9BURK|nr:LysR substrate-binding domain-containing protein [Paraburkholderia phenazinium]SIO63648.1 transcriptional regulator, LysR family [Paraburkholderia phenazinium]